MIIGIDTGLYTPNDGLRTITLTQLGFTLQIEQLEYIYNYTQKEMYFAQLEGLSNITLSNNVITIANSFDPLSSSDIILISIKEALNNSNPLPTKDVDGNDRNSLNTVFGEKTVGIRSADIAAQFQYGFPAGSADADIQNGGTITVVESMLTLSTGTNVAGLARISNQKALRYIPGHEAYIYFTCVFTEGVADSYQRAGLFDANNGFFIGYEDNVFCVTRRRDGTDYNHTVDISTVYVDGTFDPTKGNIYKISFGYLGFAVINFEVMTPEGSFVLLHKINYPNAFTVSHILNTNLQPRLEVANTGNNTNIVAKTASFTAGIVNGGGKDPASRRFAVSATAQSISAGTLMVITFRSKSTFATLTNYIQTLFTLISFNTDLSKSSLWELERNATITNTPTWTNVNTNDSIIEYSTDAVITRGTGTLDLPIPLGKVDRVLITDLEEQNLQLFPGDILTLFIITPVGTTGTYDFVFRWKELF